MQTDIFEMLVDKDEISWRSIIQDLVHSEQMDPWDVNLTHLAHEYIIRVRQMQRMDLHVSGKVVLAASLLLKIKSMRLVGEDLLEFDRLLAQPADGDEFYDDLQTEYDGSSSTPAAFARFDGEQFPIYTRTPQLRRRKVSVFDLLNALEKALEVKDRRENRIQAVDIVVPEKKIDIGVVLTNLFVKIREFFSAKKHVTFDSLLDVNTREEKVRTFIPLLYLSNERKIVLEQDGHYGDIRVLPGEVMHVNNA